MCFPTFTALGSLLLLFSFILELFIMIGNLSNTSFLRSINFAEAWNTSQNVSYTFGLWNYCTGDGYGNIASCGSRSPAFDWARAPTMSDIASSQANSSLVRGLFLGMFILFFIGCGLSFVFWCLSLPICCLKRRGWGYSMSTLVFINFLVMLAALILALVVILSGIRVINDNDSGWRAHAGYALWITIGACVSLFLSFLCYTAGSICGRKRKNKGAVDPNYKDPYATGQPYAGTPLFVPTQTGQPSTMLQQPYSVSPAVGNRAMSPTVGHQQHSIYSPNVASQSYDPNLNQGAYDASANPNYDPNSVSVPMHGYQTPTLQPANTPH